MAVLGMLACATSDSEAVFAVRVGTGPVRVAYATVEPAAGVPMPGPSFSSSVAVDAQGAAKVTVTGLTTGTRYWWRVEDNGTIDDSRTATFLTPPPAGVASSFTFAASGDAGLGGDGGATGTELRPTRISNHEIHKLIADRMIAEDWIADIDLGDSLYYNYGDTAGGWPDSTVANIRQGYDDLQLQPNQVALFDAGSYIHIEDDHEGVGGNDAAGIGTNPDWANFAQVYREREPHHPLAESGAVYRTWMWGRVQVIIWDCRYYRSPSTDPDGPSKTMLGQDQKTWFEGVLAASTAEVIIVVSSVQWITGIDDSWPGYATERQEIADMIAAAGKAGKLIMLSADSHKVAIDTGANNHWGGWPTAVFAARDATPSTVTDGYDILVQGGIGQYGTVTVTDLGSVITVKLTAWKESSELGSYTKAFATSTPTTAVDIADLVSGSHQAIIEARVLTEFQAGPDPDGETILIDGGDVTYDATADNWATASVNMPGIDETDRSSLFPRRDTDKLSIYGNELYFRRGIDRGGAGIEFVPLGYFRIDGAGQTGADDDPLTLTLPDRMEQIKEGKLIAPRQYAPTTTVAAFVYDLVLEVYPDATVIWDDDTDQLPLDRQVIVEKDRYAALRDLADAYGKIVYWDSEGLLRFEDVTDPVDVDWELAAGAGGVLIDADREVSREDIFNGIVATGEGAADATVRAVAVDVGPNSPTRWGSKFGKKPDFYSSPLITSNAQAFAAATARLRRTIGAPYSVNFSAVPNPAVRPLQSARFTYKHGDREIHILQSVTVPLSTDGAITGTTREQTLTQIGSLLPGPAPQEA